MRAWAWETRSKNSAHVMAVSRIGLDLALGACGKPFFTPGVLAVCCFPLDLASPPKALPGSGWFPPRLWPRREAGSPDGLPQHETLGWIFWPSLPIFMK